MMDGEDMSERKNDDIIIRKNTRMRIINFTMIVIIIIILLLTYSCMRFDKINDLVPTGNYDVFDIIINKCEDSICECETETEEIVTNDTGKVTKIIKKKKKKVEEEVEPKTGAFIRDDDGLYHNSNKLNIFSNPYYEFKNIIAPTSTNVYEFVVKNVNDFNITYSLKITEDNQYNINIKYRMKMNHKYVSGNEDTWVTYEDLQQQNLLLAANSKDLYELEWKWFESENDTYIGSIDADYVLKISFDGEQIEEVNEENEEVEENIEGI